MKNKKNAFTLAEVLITLAIIGVVAALTLPTLLSNYQKKEWVTRFIKTHAEITQAFQLLKAKENTSTLSNSSLWGKMTEPCNGVNFNEPVCEEFRDGLLNIFVGSEIVTYDNYSESQIKFLNGSTSDIPVTNAVIRLNNGATISGGFYPKPKESQYDVKSLGGNLYNIIASFYIDMNGPKGPNTLGRDVFAFYVSDDGTLHYVGSKDFSIYANGNELRTWNQDNTWEGCKEPFIHSEGYGCAARVLETGKMDY